MTSGTPLGEALKRSAPSQTSERLSGGLATHGRVLQPGLLSRRHCRRVAALVMRHVLLPLAVLLVAAFNLTFRLDREMVQVWDESLYATSALEMVESGQWAVTTFQGEVDYYNSKPPLNVWLIALSFKAFGVSIASLRLPSALAAWLTVLAVLLWCRAAIGDRVAWLAALILSTTYGFLYTHAGRTGNADAPLTLVVTLAFITTWGAVQRPWLAAWIGPLAAAAFMLKGPGALALIAPFVLAGALACARGRRSPREWTAPLAVALGAFAAPVGVWAYARWQFDGWRFFALMIDFDTLDRARTALDGHAEAPWYYLDILQRHHYDWLVVGLAAMLAAPSALAALRRWMADHPASKGLFAAWLTAGFLLPTLVATKLAWYINPVYPLMAVAIAAAVSHAATSCQVHGHAARAGALAALLVVALGVAEGKLAWQSYRQLDLGRSAQGLLVEHAERLRGTRVFARRCPRPEAFLARAVGARCVIAADPEVFLREAEASDVWIDDSDRPGGGGALKPHGGNPRATHNPP